MASVEEIISSVEDTFGKELEITSSLRTPYSQAKAMYPHFETNSPTLRSYATHKQKWVEEIRAAYEKGKKKEDTSFVIINDMARVIKKQFSENKLISNHLSNSARDIRTVNFSSNEISQLLSLLQSRGDLVVLDETRTSQPHIHIHLKK